MRRRIDLVIASAAAVLLAGTAWAGSVTGTVNYEGKVPNLRPIKMDADPGCAKKHSGPAANEMLVLGDGNTVANILVHVKSGVPAKSYTSPSETVVMDQNGCQYKPHVIGLMVGQTLKIKNSDGLLHNVHALPEVNSSFNRAMPASVTEFDHKFDEAEKPFKIKCDVHPWMGAFVAVFNHPYFAVTAKDGKFKIDGLPAGTYEIEAWHEKLPAKTLQLTIEGDEAQTADFTLSPPQR